MSRFVREKQAAGRINEKETALCVRCAGVQEHVVQPFNFGPFPLCGECYAAFREASLGSGIGRFMQGILEAERVNWPDRYTERVAIAAEMAGVSRAAMDRAFRQTYRT